VPQVYLATHGIIMMTTAGATMVTENLLTGLSSRPLLR